MSKHRIYSDQCGQVTATIESSNTHADVTECRGKYAVRVAVSRGRGKTWRAKSPMCVYHDPDTRAGAKRAAEDAVAFYEEKNCPVGLSGARRRRR